MGLSIKDIGSAKNLCEQLEHQRAQLTMLTQYTIKTISLGNTKSDVVDADINDIRNRGQFPSLSLTTELRASIHQVLQDNLIAQISDTRQRLKTIGVEVEV